MKSSVLRARSEDCLATNFANDIGELTRLHEIRGFARGSEAGEHGTGRVESTVRPKRRDAKDMDRKVGLKTKERAKKMMD